MWPQVALGGLELFKQVADDFDGMRAAPDTWDVLLTLAFLHISSCNCLTVSDFNGSVDQSSLNPFLLHCGVHGGIGCDKSASS